MSTEYSFADRKGVSQGIAQEADVETLLLKIIPGAVAVHPAHQSNDRLGTDYWVEHRRGTHLSVDVKIRTTDWAARPEPQRADDLALETWSVVEAGKVGWTRDVSKRTDFVLWLWADTGRWCLMPFPLLCKAFSDHWEQWSDRYGTRRQYTPGYRGYHSECVFVPRDDVWKELYRSSHGVLSKAVEPSDN